MSQRLSDAERKALLVNRFFAEMPDTARDLVASRGMRKRLRSGERLFSKGDATDGVYAVLSGSLRYSTISPSGKEAVLNILGLGKWAGDISSLDGQGRTLDCDALEATTLMHLGGRDFNQLLDSVPAFARMLLKIQGERIRMLLSWNEALTKLGAEGRLAARLLIFADSHGIAAGQQVKINVRLSQESLASLIGTTRQRVNQILINWQEKDLVDISNRMLVIRDLSAIREYVDLS